MYPQEFFLMVFSFSDALARTDMALVLRYGGFDATIPGITRFHWQMTTIDIATARNLISAAAGYLRTRDG